EFDIAMSKPSDETATDKVTPLVPSTKLVSSQLKLRACALSSCWTFTPHLRRNRARHRHGLGPSLLGTQRTTRSSALSCSTPAAPVAAARAAAVPPTRRRAPASAAAAHPPWPAGSPPLTLRRLPRPRARRLAMLRCGATDPAPAARSPRCGRDGY